MKIKKANGNIQEFDSQRIINAIKKAAKRTNKPLTDGEIANVLSEVSNIIGHYAQMDLIVDVDTIHEVVNRALAKVRIDVSSEYRNYRAYKRSQNEHLKTIEDQMNNVSNQELKIDYPQSDKMLDELIRKHPTEHYYTLLVRLLNDIERGGNEQTIRAISDNKYVEYLSTRLYNKHHIYHETNGDI